MPSKEELGSLLPAIVAPLPAPRSQALVEVLAQTESPAFTTRRARRHDATGAPHDPIVWSEARGANVIDADGNRYVDLTGGFGVVAGGHAAPSITRAVQAQSERLPHALGDLYPSDTKIALLRRLSALAPFDDARVALALTGAGAIEIALKTAVLKTGRPGILAFEGGYHGLSHGALAACGYAASFREPFASQLNPAVAFAPFPEHGAHVQDALDAVWRAWPDPAPGCVLVEPVQARGGVRVPPPGFLSGLADGVRQRGALFVVDEIFTGLGRCGARYRSVADGVVPDVLCLGKALGGGFPISACLAPLDVMKAWGDPSGAALHTGTFFGHPVACAAALASLDLIEAEELAERAERLGRRCREMLMPLLAHPAVTEIRGSGLLIGVRFTDAGGEIATRRCLRIVRALLEVGYLTLPAGPRAEVLQIAPPLTIHEELLEGFATTLGSLLERGTALDSSAPSRRAVE